mmetsp:Transcript_25162/g.32554  ORF Transcript_25162/g.32554 Transcript_25162/m.32554 type:complete len:511 (+) Transcript_25162:32-1564(+)
MQLQKTIGIPGFTTKVWASSAAIVLLSSFVFFKRESLRKSFKLLGWQKRDTLHPQPDEPTTSQHAHGTASEILDRRKKMMCGNQSISYSSEPLVIVKGHGPYLYDENGTEYLDCVNNVAHVGHCHPKVVEASNCQLATLNTNTRYLHPARMEYMEKLLATFPDRLSVCFLVCSGTEANDLALRLARAATNSAEDVIVIDGAYHGHTSALIDISPYKHGWQGKGKAPPHVHTVPAPDLYRGGHSKDTTNAGSFYAQSVCDAVTRLSKDGKRPAAFFAESILGCCGQVVLPPGYLKKCYSAVREAGGICVADEVQVGFGRCGTHFWAFETQEVVPDIVTMGKPIGNGYPMAAVVTTKEIAEKFNNGIEYFNTFGGSTAACVVGKAVLEVIKEESLQDNALRIGSYIKEGFERLKDKYECIGYVRGMGLFLGFEVVRDKASKEPDGHMASLLSLKMKREYKVLISTDGPYNSVIKIKPPMCFSKVCADKLLTSLDQCLKELSSSFCEASLGLQ